jgi:hypothetical protein
VERLVDLERLTLGAAGIPMTSRPGPTRPATAITRRVRGATSKTAPARSATCALRAAGFRDDGIRITSPRNRAGPNEGGSTAARTQVTLE